MNIHRFLPALALAFCIYLLNVPVDIMDVDAAQYASMGREMLENGDFLHVYDRGNEYLDKPPLIFWLTAVSYQLFGINNFAFKFPAILFALLGVFAVYRFGRLWYDRETGALAAIILGITQGYFHFTNDVRTDVFLTNSVIACVWLLSEQIKSPRSFWWIPAFFFAGIGMLAKGPLGLVVPALALGTHVLITRDFKLIFNWRWLAGLVVVLVVLSPMLLGLYQQFDAQPDKLVNGRHHVSGLRFFFWEQSFGRITGENVWKNDSGPFFFVHSFAWSFLPWTLFFLAGFFNRIYNLARETRSTLASVPEWISFGGFLLPFIALSFSKYKLPHYIYVVFPFAAIITAFYLVTLFRQGKASVQTILLRVQWAILLLVWGFAGVIFLWFFPLRGIIEYTVAFLGLAAFIYFAFGGKFLTWQRIVFISLGSALSINVLLALRFYPSVLDYQAGGKIGRYIREKQINPDLVFNYMAGSRALDVYAQATIRDLRMDQLDSLLSAQQHVYLFTGQDGFHNLSARSIPFNVILKLDDFPVTLLRMNFGNPQKRPETLRPKYLLEIKS
ncbi:MAG: glycosyltransferase family 39 protein [Bacteroidia bacterium]